MKKELKNLQTFEQHTDKNLNISDVRNRFSVGDKVYSLRQERLGDISVVDINKFDELKGYVVQFSKYKYDYEYHYPDEVIKNDF